MMSIELSVIDVRLTHRNRLLVMLPAADQMCDFGGDFCRKGTAVCLYPLLNFVVGACLTKVSGDGDCKRLERVFHLDDYSVK